MLTEKFAVGLFLVTSYSCNWLSVDNINKSLDEVSSAIMRAMKILCVETPAKTRAGSFAYM